jgi:hypothetical protein
MSEPHNVSASTTAEAEEFFATGTQTWPPESATAPKRLCDACACPLNAFGCCVGVDVPGVGHVHWADCVRLHRATLPATDHVPGKVPEPLRSYVSDLALVDREGLLGQLLFAARDLAQANIYDPRRREPNRLGMFDGCQECRRKSYLNTKPHLTTCRTGRVLDLVDRILAVGKSSTSQSIKKEAAPAEESHAGDGIRSGEGCLRDAVEVVRSVVCEAAGAPVGHYGDHTARQIVISDVSLKRWATTLDTCDALLGSGPGGPNCVIAKREGGAK